MNFRIAIPPADVEIIAVGSSIRELERLRKVYGKGRWRKLKGVAVIELEDGALVTAELHWYEAQGYEKKEFKIKCFLEGSV